MSQYHRFRDVVHVGDSITVEKIYNKCLPIFEHLGKHNYYNILLDKTKDHCHRIPYQLTRENQFQKLYDDINMKQTEHLVPLGDRWNAGINEQKRKGIIFIEQNRRVLTSQPECYAGIGV